MGEGEYNFWVNNYSYNKSRDGFTAQIEFDGQVHDFEYGKSLSGGANIKIAKVHYSKSKGFEIESLLDSTTKVISKEKWGLKTNQFHKVNKIMFSPNYWEYNNGNKHFLFFLQDCVSDENTRGLFNEFLKEELKEHRKVFEILGSKLKIENDKNQLSGVGFSDTLRNHVILKVGGKFTRLLKVLI